MNILVKEKSEGNMLLFLLTGSYVPILINLTAVQLKDPPKAVLEVPWQKEKMKHKRISSHINSETDCLDIDIKIQCPSA